MCTKVFNGTNREGKNVSTDEVKPLETEDKEFLAPRPLSHW